MVRQRWDLDTKLASVIDRTEDVDGIESEGEDISDDRVTIFSGIDKEMSLRLDNSEMEIGS